MNVIVFSPMQLACTFALEIICQRSDLMYRNIIGLFDLTVDPLRHFAIYGSL